ncbi:MAG TPA: DUF5985 family protein [Vicinamibacteria bacterium]
MAGAVYLLSAVTCLVCAGLLLRAYRRTRARLLLWSGICFVGLTADNVLLFVDAILIPEVSLAPWRGLPALAGLCALLYGLVWETR